MTCTLNAGLSENRCLSKSPTGATLLQIGEQDVAFGAKFRARVVLDIQEHSAGNDFASALLLRLECLLLKQSLHQAYTSCTAIHAGMLLVHLCLYNAVLERMVCLVFGC